MSRYFTNQFSPIVSIWTSPKRTMRQIMARDEDHQVSWLFFLAGVCSSLRNASADNFEYWGLLEYLLIVPLISGVIGLIIYNILVFLLQGTQKWFGGSGKLINTQNAVGWSLAPFFCYLLILLLKISILGPTLIADTSAHYYANWTFLILNNLVWLWNIILLVNTLSVAHHYSRVKAFLNLVVCILIVASPFLAIFGLFYLLS